MDASALTCPQCGAAAAAESTACTFCHARLATVACGSCFGLVFIGSKHCAHCGMAISSPDSREGRPRACPRGCGALRRIVLGAVELDECQRCSGVWLEQRTFQRLCVEEERQAIVLGPVLESRRGPTAPAQSVRYVPCPDCAKLMNRVNFGKRSGIILDGCASHGTWFDAEELRRAIEFVRDGGLERARTRERMYLAEERRLLDAKQSMIAATTPKPPYGGEAGDAAPGAVADLVLRLFGVR